jgi:glycine cleavage system aminomethyltransferase T
MTSAEFPSLASLLEKAGGAVPLLRSSQLPPFTFPGQPINHDTWRDEHRSWRQTISLFNMSFHMTELRLRGKDVIPFLQKYAVNKLGTFAVLSAKQLVVTAPDGNLIGDAIIQREDEDFFRIAGAPPLLDWLTFTAIGEALDVTTERDEAWLPWDQHDRDIYRLQLQGPNVMALLTELVGDTFPDIGFFRIGEFAIAGRPVRAVRHGMAGTPGFEIYGPWADHETVRTAIEEAGTKHGLVKVGGLQPAFPVESGWFSMPLPAIYTDPYFAEYREWLDTRYVETIASLRGSRIRDNVEDYYVDAIEAGYGKLVDWDQDFLGRDALREKADNQKRRKVSLVWNDEDVTAAIGAGLFGNPSPGHYVSLPNLTYGTFQNDAVVVGGETVGASTLALYSSNAEHVLSNAIVGLEHAEPGTEVTVLWGDPTLPHGGNNGSELREIRATVATSPYFAKENAKL